MTPAEVKRLLESTGAIRRGHFQLSSGLHSSVYVQCALVLQHPDHTGRLAQALAQRFARIRVEVVAAPALGGIVLGYELARQLGARTVFVERDFQGHFALRRFQVETGARVLVAEDVLTTGGSTRETLEVFRQAGAEVVGVATVVDRSGGGVELDVPVQALLTQSLDTFASADCPLCRAGTPLEKPGSRPARSESAVDRGANPASGGTRTRA